MCFRVRYTQNENRKLTNKARILDDVHPPTRALPTSSAALPGKVVAGVGGGDGGGVHCTVQSRHTRSAHEAISGVQKDFLDFQPRNPCPLQLQLRPPGSIRCGFFLAANGVNG